MQSINFEFLRPKWTELADLAGFAELYIHSDPASSLTKSRSCLEHCLKWVCLACKITFSLDERPSIVDLINALKDKGNILDFTLINKMHFVRRIGNQGVHTTSATTNDAKLCLKELFDIARWLYVSTGGKKANIQPFTMPRSTQKSPSETQELERRDDLLRKALEELELERSKNKALQKEAEQHKPIPPQVLGDVLGFSEEDTRKHLIDVILASSSWDIHDKKQVELELEVEQQPTDSGTGFCDYVLFSSNGSPLAVIEAKKCSKSPDLGKDQAYHYANGLEKKFGQRPFIFYTNGHEIWLWDDKGGINTAGLPPRKVFSIPSQKILERRMLQRTKFKDPRSIAPKQDIINRDYQQEAIARVCEAFTDNNKRKALMVLATGTGKTRVAIALADVLQRANWAERILFLCDRVELRRQAYDAFDEFMPSTSRTILGYGYDKSARIVVSTYPTMQKRYRSFDIGEFDLIIADESHRSIYNKYRDIFLWFDALQLGLTATPVNIISRNTYKMFECDDQNPTMFYSYEDAINHTPPYLATFELVRVRTKFRRQGLRYQDLDEEQRRQLEENNIDPQDLDYDASAMDKVIFNKPTNAEILHDVMEHGLRDASGQKPGKSIIFARNHEHAMYLGRLFYELYPQYGGDFCAVIDNYNPRAEQLIIDFKQADKATHIAISVDMLDTGIDVPEVVNLVFARPIKSLVKFWQMIGRGTRLCQNLFGQGQHKNKFYIFDHWDNFNFFGMNYKEVTPSENKSIVERVFLTRLQLMEAALKAQDVEFFKYTTKLVREMIKSLPDDSPSVKDKFRQKSIAIQEGVLEQFKAETIAAIKKELSPLMRQVNIGKEQDAWSFDDLVSRLQLEKLNQTALLADLWEEVNRRLTALRVNLNPVKEKLDLLNAYKQESFQENASINDMETMRKDMRGLMRYQEKLTPPPTLNIEIDIDDRDITRTREDSPYVSGWDMQAYKQQVHEVLEPLMQESVVQKIRNAEQFTKADFEALVSLVLTHRPDVDIKVLQEFYPVTEDLALALRSIVGLSPDIIEARFASFATRWPELKPNQQKFISMLKQHILQYGIIQAEKLYDAPFTAFSSAGPDGIFNDEQLDDLFAIIKTFDPAGVKYNDL